LSKFGTTVRISQIRQLEAIQVRSEERHLLLLACAFVACGRFYCYLNPVRISNRVMDIWMSSNPAAAAGLSLTSRIVAMDASDSRMWSYLPWILMTAFMPLLLYFVSNCIYSQSI
jgi:hypothetical protein